MTVNLLGRSKLYWCPSSQCCHRNVNHTSSMHNRDANDSRVLVISDWCDNPLIRVCTILGENEISDPIICHILVFCVDRVGAVARPIIILHYEKGLVADHVFYHRNGGKRPGPTDASLTTIRSPQVPAPTGPVWAVILYWPARNGQVSAGMLSTMCRLQYSVDSGELPHTSHPFIF